MTRSCLLLATLAAALLPAGPAGAQSVGAPYAAREPRACPPTKGVDKPSKDLAAALVVCGKEGTFGDKLYLVGGLTVEIGGSRKYQEFADSGRTAVDTDAPIYPIRGGMVVYQCDRISTYDPNTGKNCRAYAYPHAEGGCWRTTFGDWSCSMLDTSVTDAYRSELPPPP